MKTTIPRFSLMKSLLQHASVKGSKSTVLKPLGWALVLVFPSVLASTYIGAPEWITIMFAVMLALVFTLYMAAYIFFAFTQ